MGIIVHEKVSLECGVAQSDVVKTIRGAYNISKGPEKGWRITCTEYTYCNADCYRIGMGSIQCSCKIWDVDVLPVNVYAFIYAQLSEPWRKSGTVEDI